MSRADRQVGRNAPKVLLTGFEPFGRFAVNPTALAVRRLARDPTCRRSGLVTSVLPVDRRAAPERLERLLRRHRPRLLLMSGVAAGRTGIELERLAVNRWRDPDGTEPEGPVLEGAEAELPSTLPLERALTALRRAGVPCGVSDDAGTYACNLVLHRALSWSREGRPGAAAPDGIGFVHVPPTPGSLGEEGSGTPTLSLEQVVAGLRALVLEL